MRVRCGPEFGPPPAATASLAAGKTHLRRPLTLRSCELGGRMANVHKTMLRFLKRSGHDITIADNVGQTHHATLTRIEESVFVREEGSFTFGYCKSCNWAGS